MARKDPRIDELRHEGPGEWFVYLVPGWQMDGAHCFGEDTRHDVTATMKRVRPCECNECEVAKIGAALDEVLRFG